MFWASQPNQAAGINAIGIIMTVMGNDGAKGMQELHNTGALTIAQDEQSCAVYGIPKEAVKAGGVDGEVPLLDIVDLIVHSPDRKPFVRQISFPCFKHYST